jgi:HD-GYP domain-containing protein (c-di-GMP phosphodiesterase class II)
VDHHKHVAYIASALSTELGLTEKEETLLMMAGALHDTGALSLKERIDTLSFEMKSPHEHAEAGYLLLKTFEPFSRIATMIRYHHVPWNGGKGSEFMGKPVPVESHILHLADRVDILIDRQKEVLGQIEGICKVIENKSGIIFMPELVKAFMRLARKESFWLDTVFPSMNQILATRISNATMVLDLEGLLDLAKLFSRIIDFRSPFTAVHSSGVAASAETLAGYCGFSEQQCQMMRIAGYLHDLGKLAVPTEILESPSKLGEDDFRMIKHHSFYTCRILETISELDVINKWASFHHERLEGEGYPFHYGDKELSLGSRIMSVADVFTAITEDRPYRKGMRKEETLQVLQQMVETSKLDSDIVSTLKLHYNEINSVQMTDQSQASREYEEYWCNLKTFAEGQG